MRKRRRGAVIVSRPSGSAIGRQSAPVTVCVLNAAAFSDSKQDRAMKTVWAYVDTRKKVGDPDHC